MRGVIDSLNLSHTSLEEFFINKEDYIIESVKTIGTFEPHRWKETFGKSLTQNIVEAKIIHTNRGLQLPLKRFSVAQNQQTLEFAGLHQYDDNSYQLLNTLNNLKSELQDSNLTRIDIAIDFNRKPSKRLLKNLNRYRTHKRYWNTKYFKSDSELKKNNRLNIKLYNKSVKDTHISNIYRLEFSFLSSYMQNTKLEDLSSLIKRMEKTIKRFSGLSVQIQPL